MEVWGNIWCVGGKKQSKEGKCQGTQSDRKSYGLDWNRDHKVLGYCAKKLEQQPVR